VGQTVFAQAYVNLRRSAGYVGKPSDDVVGQLPAGAPVEQIGGPLAADGLTWWQVRGPLLDNRVATGWAAEVDPSGRPLLAETQPALSPPVPTQVHGTPFRLGDALVVLNPANLRKSAAYRGQAPDHVLASLARGTALSVAGGPQPGDDLEWWEVTLVQAERTLTGWMALTAPDGTRLLATATTAAALHVQRPFVGQWAVTWGWGIAPDYYAQFPYDGVPLKGHNGLDFATPPGTPILAADRGQVIRVDDEPDGFGYHVLLRHAWGESLYAHLERIDVIHGARLGPGEPLGLSGESGKTFGAHLHFGIRIYPYTRGDGWGGFVNPIPHMAAADLVFSRAAGRPSPMAPELPGRPRP
jgi:murein DD-endopeptidase MepM/ murein hydrolase activator NlpD